ncbi:hypothetical protein Tco_0162614 [Tanacetum coccineum]
MSNCLDYHEWKHQLLMERTWDSWKGFHESEELVLVLVMVSVIEGLIQKVYGFKRFLNRLNDDDVIVVPHENAQATLGDTNDLFTSISMSKDLADKDFQ